MPTTCVVIVVAALVAGLTAGCSTFGSSAPSLVGGSSQVRDSAEDGETTTAESTVPTATTVARLDRPATRGHLLLAAVSWDGDGTLFARGGATSWAATAPATRLGGGGHAQVLYGIAGGDPADTDVTVTTTSGTRLLVSLREYAGIDAAAPLIARSPTITPPDVGDATGGGLLVSTTMSLAAPADIRDRPVRLASPGRPLVAEPGSDRAVQTMLFRSGSSTVPARDPRMQPFASTSIWNTAIGARARYISAGLPAVPGGDRFAPMPQNDETSIIETPDAPMTELRYSSAAWTGRDRCASTGSKVLYRVPMPADYLVPSSTHNEGASWLMPDGRTVNQSGPLARCAAGRYATSVDTSPSIDLYGDGISRSLGGSGLSGLVGALRIGEMRPSTDLTGVRHALRINLDTDRQVARCEPDQCYRWPASTADTGAEKNYGRKGSPPTQLRLGSLLAIPAGVDLDTLGLRTQPGRQLAWTLQNYGAYVADSSACACFAIVTEKGPGGSFADQFRRDYGTDFAQRVSDGTPWTRDLQTIQTALAIVDSNSPSTIGGGGLPLQPPAPAVTP